MSCSQNKSLFSSSSLFKGDAATTENHVISNSNQQIVQASKDRDRYKNKGGRSFWDNVGVNLAPTQIHNNETSDQYWQRLEAFGEGMKQRGPRYLRHPLVGKPGNDPLA